MRAAIEAYDAGADVALVSKIHPVRSHSGAAEGGINAALGNASEDSPEEHAFDTVKGSDYLGDQDAIEILCDEAPGDVYQLEHWGAVFSRTEDGRIAQRPFGAAGEPRTAYAADITGHVLIQVLYEQVMKRDIQVYEEYFAWKLVVDDDRCQGVIAWDLLNGGLKTIGAKTVDPRDGRRGPALHRHDQRVRLHRRRDGDGAARRRAAEGHGDDAVPPDDARADRRADHRGLPRRGRVPPQLRRRALPEALRAERDGARLARRHLRAEQTEIDEGRGIDGNVLLDLRHLGAEKILERLHGTRELVDDVRGRRPDLRADPGPAGAHYHMGGVDTDVWGRTELDGPLRGGRVRLHLGARREPPGRERADGDDHLRPARRAGTRPTGRSRTRPSTCPSRSRRDAERELRQLLDRIEGERPWQIRDELAATMHENFGVFRREEQIRSRAGSSRACASATRAWSSMTRARSSTTTSPRRSSSATCSTSPRAWSRAGLARKESRGAHARPHDYPERDDENYIPPTMVRLGRRTAGSTGSRSRSRSGSPRNGNRVAGRRLLALLAIPIASSCGTDNGPQASQTRRDAPFKCTFCRKGRLYSDR